MTALRERADKSVFKINGIVLQFEGGKKSTFGIVLKSRLSNTLDHQSTFVVNNLRV